MLTQYRLLLKHDGREIPRNEWAYHLYSALLEDAPPGFGDSAHINGATPISQHLRLENGRILWVVNLLGESCESALSPVIENKSEYRLTHERTTLRVIHRDKKFIPDADTLFAMPGGLHTIRFHTPGGFKSGGVYVNLPTSRLIVQSLINKWNGCITECPIDDPDNEGMEALAQGLRIRNFEIKDSIYHLKGNSVPGFVGSITVENRLNGFHREIADALLNFSDYSGIGIKTTLGMGGTEHL